MVKLTDQEMNEWVASKLLEWKCFKKDKSGVKYYYNKENPRIPWYIGHNLDCFLPRFNPCHDLNHTHLMEDKIRDMDKHGDYLCNLVTIVNAKKGMGVEIWSLTHASARQRCEAALITFNNEDKK